MSKIKIPRKYKHLKNEINYSPDKQYAIMRSSICTGEKVLGFKNYSDGYFTEVLAVKEPEDIEIFKMIYGITDIKTEY